MVKVNDVVRIGQVYYNILKDHGKELYIIGKNGYNYIPKRLIDEIITDETIIRQVRMDTLIYNSMGRPYSVGSDPEIFIESFGKCVPAFNFLGSKTNPNIGRFVANGRNKIYWDGFQAEFDTTASQCLAWHVDSVQNGLASLYDIVEQKKQEGVIPHDSKLSLKTTMWIDKEELENAKEEHVQFGCMPSKNAYGMQGMNLNGRLVNFRSAGGHIHFGYKFNNDEQIIGTVKTLDAILGVMCVAFFNKFDKPERRTMYGLAGEYRTPEHGLEYRVLSNAWLCHPLIMNITFDIARTVFKMGINGYRKYWDATDDETINCINNCDVKLARKILDRNEKVFLKILENTYVGAIQSQYNQLLFNSIKKGVGSLIKDPTNLVENWKLNKKWDTHSEGPNCNWYKACISLNEMKVKSA